MAMQNINSVLLGLVQMMNNFTTIDANKDGVISQDEVNIWAASVIPNASQEELPLYDIFTSQKTDGSKNELGAANFKALANGDDTVNNDDIARMQKFLTPLDPNAPGSTTLLYGGQPLNRDETLELLVQNGTLTREQADKYKADNATLEEIKIVLKPTPFATMENTNPANPEDPASTLKRVNQAIDKLVEQGQLTQEKANELKAQAAEDPTKVWISLVGIGGNLTTSEKTVPNNQSAEPTEQPTEPNESSEPDHSWRTDFGNAYRQAYI